MTQNTIVITMSSSAGMYLVHKQPVSWTCGANTAASCSVYMQPSIILVGADPRFIDAVPLYGMAASYADADTSTCPGNSRMSSPAVTARPVATSGT